MKEKLFEGEKGVFIGSGKTVFGENGFGSLMAVPMIENDTVFGFAILLKKDLYAFTFEMYKLFQALIHHATLAVTNSMLRDRLEHLVQTDQLTELYSRTYLDEKIQYSMKIHKRGVFILVDIDNFKTINDTYGHQTGDSILIQVASVMKNHIREHDVAARWGGEELAVYLPNINVSSGERIAKRLVRAIRENTEPRFLLVKDRPEAVENARSASGRGALYRQTERQKPADHPPKQHDDIKKEPACRPGSFFYPNRFSSVSTNFAK